MVANPSSYAYLSAERPHRPGDHCQTTLDRWKYGLHDLPPYAAGAAAADLTRVYLAREVIYLLGTNDDNPNHDEFDHSCEAKAQGHSRLARGVSYFAYLQKQHPKLGHRLRLVFGVSHSARDMFTSTCGLTVLFDSPGCGQ